MAAEVLAEAGWAVTVFERMPSVGRKLLLAGRGGLNLTHAEGFAAFRTRYGAASDWLAPALEAFPPDALRAWCHGLGIETFVGSSGRVFPRGLKTSPLLRAWLGRLRALGVVFETRQLWTGWDAAGALMFRGADGAVRTVAPAATVLALGGASWPRLGSDGGWTAILSASGVAVVPLRPANCGFVCAWSALFRARFAGVPLKGVLAAAGGVAARGDAVVTEYGIEGGAIYPLAAPLRAALERDGAATLTLDLRPEIGAGALAARLGMVRERESLANLLRKGAHLAPVAAHLLREAGEVPRAAPALAARIKAVPLRVTAAQPLARAISTAGGVARAAVDARLMLRARPGVFVAGEMLDWEAPTGGYLLQGCFALGRFVGVAIREGWTR